MQDSIIKFRCWINSPHGQSRNNSFASAIQPTRRTSHRHKTKCAKIWLAARALLPPARATLTRKPKLPLTLSGQHDKSTCQNKKRQAQTMQCVVFLGNGQNIWITSGLRTAGMPDSQHFTIHQNVTIIVTNDGKLDGNKILAKRHHRKCRSAEMPNFLQFFLLHVAQTHNIVCCLSFAWNPTPARNRCSSDELHRSTPDQFKTRNELRSYRHTTAQGRRDRLWLARCRR